MRKLNKKFLFLILFLAFLKSNSFFAARIDTISIPSASMGVSYAALLVIPDTYQASKKKYPVLYLLHGYSGHFSGWIDIATTLRQWSDLYQMILVCPDGDKDSWYIDSPVQKNRNFETYISKEVVGFIDNNYRTFNRPESRGISGVSMGGHGAMYLALKYPDVFGLIGSTSGGLDLLPFSDHWNLQTLLGSYPEHLVTWKNYSCYYLLDNIKSSQLKIWIDVGTEDFFLEVNRKFHQKLLEKNIAHEYLEKPGGHTLEYWKDSYRKEILFFMEKFRR
jgi:S-formylglutathione hydrolase FrmB